MKMSNKIYDILKTVCTIVLPAVAALYAALGKIWGFPLIVEIVGTIAAVDTFIGALIGLSSVQYGKDHVTITADEYKEISTKG